MAQNITGLRSILSHPSVYDLFSRVLGSQSARRTVADEYIRARPGDRILDIGCGTAETLAHLPDVEYHGFDLNPAYINAAQQRFGSRGTFHCQALDPDSHHDVSQCDIVLALGVLHHLDDEDAINLFTLARQVLKPDGRLVTIDPCLVDPQSRVARYLINRDRGQNIRTEPGYRGLAATVFANPTVRVRHDLLRIPYTHIITECTDRCPPPTTVPTDAAKPEPAHVSP